MQTLVKTLTEKTITLSFLEKFVAARESEHVDETGLTCHDVHDEDVDHSYSGQRSSAEILELDELNGIIARFNQSWLQLR